MAKVQLHPGARWVFRIRAYFSMIFLFVFLFFLSISVSTVFGFSFLGFIFADIIFILVVGEIYARMSYNRWFYDFTETHLKTERGIIWKKYSNVPYERVQNVDIHRGIVARMLGFSSLNIQTAGFSVPVSGQGGAGSEGFLPAVEMNQADKIREFLMKKIHGKSKSGL
ncbi:MAG: PH domain-containing protein [Nanoarchaeota archaeon]|nr:PH domain-containing protein [Nanoarchaeota archaeon]